MSALRGIPARQQPHAPPSKWGVVCGGREQRGVALIMAMVVLFLAVSVAGFLTVREHQAIERTAAVIDQGQALQYLYGVEQWVGTTLSKQLKRTAWISLDQPWASPLPPTAIGPGGADTLEGYVDDLQGRFNLNNLVRGARIDPLAQARFARLLEALKLPDTLEQAVIDWLGVHGAQGMAGGADTQEAYYLGRTPPYVAANRPFASVTTLRLVRGFTPSVYARIAPYLSALPTGTAINVNTAPAEVLRALGLDAAQASAVVKARKRAPFTTLQAFLQSPALSGAQPPPTSRLSVTSRYFAVHSRLLIGGETSVPYVSTLTLDGAGHTRVLARTIDFQTPAAQVSAQATQDGS